MLCWSLPGSVKKRRMVIHFEKFQFPTTLYKLERTLLRVFSKTGSFRALRRYQILSLTRLACAAALQRFSRLSVCKIGCASRAELRLLNNVFRLD